MLRVASRVLFAACCLLFGLIFGSLFVLCLGCCVMIDDCCLLTVGSCVVFVVVATAVCLLVVVLVLCVVCFCMSICVLFVLNVGFKYAVDASCLLFIVCCVMGNGSCLAVVC